MKHFKLRDLTSVQKWNFLTISLVPIIFIVLGFILDTPKEILKGLSKIILHPGMLLVDYIAVGGIGATFVNSAIIMLVCILFVYLLKMDITGPLIAGIFTAGGFAFIGKNIYNVWPIFMGGYIYTRYKKTEYKSVLLVMMFAAALSPTVTYVSFELGSIPLGILIGIVIGILVPAMAAQMLKFHDGYNLYNIGFTCGILGTLIAALFRGFGHPMLTQSVLSNEYNVFLKTFLLISFISCILILFISNGYSFKGYASLFSRSGRGLSNHTELFGYKGTYTNMAFMGLISTIYVILVKGDFNGPVMAGVLTAVGFSAFGKHPKNSIPIMLGVFLGGTIMKYDVSSAGLVIAALFGTTLAPIAGAYGTIPGIIAGFLHVAMVNNTGSLHGGLNLYNNGFSGGIIAAILIPIYNSLMTKKIDD